MTEEKFGNEQAESESSGWQAPDGSRELERNPLSREEAAGQSLERLRESERNLTAEVERLNQEIERARLALRELGSSRSARLRRHSQIKKDQAGLELLFRKQAGKESLLGDVRQRIKSLEQEAAGGAKKTRAA